MKVLISAYACAPGSGSEPGAGWAWVHAAAQEHEIWVMTRSDNAPYIEPVLATMPEPKPHMVYLDLPERSRRWKKGRRGVHVYYLIFQVLAWRAARRLHATVDFDVAHHITFAVDWMPASFAWVPDLPFVWGPVGGSTGIPWRLFRLRWLGLRGATAEAAREALTRGMRRTFGDATARRAAIVVCQNDDVARRFRFTKDHIVEPNVALSLPPVAHAPAREPGATTPVRRALFVGRLIPLKGLRLAVAAMSWPESAGWVLDVYGEGPEEQPARSLARKLGIEDRVHFHGQTSRDDVLRAVADADAMLFPSMHDAAPWSVGEAVALGCPVIYLDRGGPPVITRGLKTAVGVPADGRAVKRIAVALGACTEREAPSDRWNADRLPAMLSSWYERAAKGRGPVPARETADAPLHAARASATREV